MMFMKAKLEKPLADRIWKSTKQAYLNNLEKIVGLLLENLTVLD